MYVKDRMTKAPLTIGEKESISKALEIMRKNDFHRLPVTDGNGKLLGLITGGLVEEQSGAKDTSLSIFELNYLLSRRTVADIMIRDVNVCKEDMFLEEAASIMLDQDISCLPVVDDDRKVVGIITEKDIFMALIDIVGYGRRGTRFVLSAEDRPGYMEGICRLFAENDANMDELAVFHTEERGTEVSVKASGEIPVEDMRDVLKKNGYKVSVIVQTDENGKRIVYSV
ncbi:MAG: CBS domain-containing protein [Lachnospiraceae bacterium]|nr:CBS domain-containing protein [Lachnospiraceae bacterium]